MRIFLNFSLTLLFLSQYCSCLSIADFYPFGISAGDFVLFKNDDGFSERITISTTFPFFNKSYDLLFINTNGLISFERGISAFTPVPFPLQDVIGVSPFWTDIDISVGGEIYYREILDSNLLNQFSSEIRRAFPSLYNFRPTWAYLATWYQVAAFGSSRPDLNNTFQATVLTNGQYSFTIFNYEVLMWPNNVIKKTVQAGFNAGDNITYYTINGSFTESIPTILQSTSNVGINGKWIFRVDKNNITSGGCSTAGYLTVTPNSVFFIGGTYITISGPCFNFDDSVKITFDGKINDEEECEVVSLSACKCKVPFINRIGRIPLALNVTGLNVMSYFTGNLFTKNEPVKLDITGLSPYYSLDQLNEVVNISWNSKYQQNLSNAKYVLFLYSIDTSNSTTNKLMRQTNIIILKEIFQDVKFWVVKVKDIVADKIEFFQRKFINYLGIGVMNLISDSVATFEYITQINLFDLETLNMNSPCLNWHRKQPDPRKYMDHFCRNNIACRPNIDANFPASFDTFIQDKSCNPKNPEWCNLFHLGSKGCYRSTSLGIDGSQQQCCYNSAGRLNVGPPGGGTLDLTSSDVSVLGHYFDDVLPFYQCCIYSKSCNLYFEKRPSDDGKCWVPPAPSGLTGDPHFLTLDDVKYTFNGWGEYILLEILEISFKIQVRLEPFKNSQGVLTQGTVFRGIAVAGNDIDTVQIELNEANDVITLLNGFIYEFDQDETLVLNGLYLISSNSAYNFIFKNGITIKLELVNTGDLFFILTSVPSNFMSKTRGLLGVMDGNQKNEFTLPNGAVVSIDPENDRDIYYKFGQVWANNENNTIFTYIDSFSYYNFNKSYVPSFLSDGINFTNESLKIIAEEKCGKNKQCLYDIITTGEIAIGESTLKFDEEIAIFKQEIEIASNGGGWTKSNKISYLIFTFLLVKFI